MTNNELKPCPFCGVVPSLEKTITGKYFIMCQYSDCVMHVVTFTRYLKKTCAITAWNRRSE